MDAKADDWVVTPRIGKPIEISALWHNALHCMIHFSDQPQPSQLYKVHRTRRSKPASRLQQILECRTKLLLRRSRHAQLETTAALRPNQLFAVSLGLRTTSLSKQQQQAVVDTCAAHLLTSHGMRSLAPTHPDYIGKYKGDRIQRDGSLPPGHHLELASSAPSSRLTSKSTKIQPSLAPFSAPLLQHHAIRLRRHPQRNLRRQRTFQQKKEPSPKPGALPKC